MSHPNRIYLTPMPVRIWHWINALGIVTLCITGAQIRFPEYFNLFGSYKATIWLHNAAGIVVSVFYIVWFLYYALIARKLLRLYVPSLSDLKVGLFKQAHYYFFNFFMGGPNPHQVTPDNKFNPLQKTAYMAIMLGLVPLIIITGLLLLNITPLRDWIIMIGGIKIIIALHFLIGCSFAAFVISHIYLATLGPTPIEHFKPMWTGWEDHHS